MAAQTTSLTEKVLALHHNNNPKPYEVLPNIITPEETAAMREYFLDDSRPSYSAKRGDYTKSVVGFRPRIPSFEARIHALFPEMLWFACQYFAGKAPNGQYSGWHTDLNGGKPFKGNPRLITIWIPFQTLTEETGGRLWFYNGPKTEAVLDMLDFCDKKTMVFQYLMLDLLEKEIESHKTTGDCHYGEGFAFPGKIIHSVDSNCQIEREAIALRLVDKDVELDEEFLEEVSKYVDGPQGIPVANTVEEQKHMLALHRLLSALKSEFLESKAYKAELKLE